MSFDEKGFKKTETNRFLATGCVRHMSLPCGKYYKVHPNKSKMVLRLHKKKCSICRENIISQPIVASHSVNVMKRPNTFKHFDDDGSFFH